MCSAFVVDQTTKAALRLTPWRDRPQGALVEGQTEASALAVQQFQDTPTVPWDTLFARRWLLTLSIPLARTQTGRPGSDAAAGVS